MKRYSIALHDHSENGYDIDVEIKRSGNVVMKLEDISLERACDEIRDAIRRRRDQALDDSGK